MLVVSVSGVHDSLHRQDLPDLDATLRTDLRTLHPGNHWVSGQSPITPSPDSTDNWKLP